MTAKTQAHVWPTLHYDDAPAAIEFLETALGFEVVASYPDDDNPAVIHHAELRWPPGGAIMLGSGRGMPEAPRPKGTGSVYLMTDRPDDLYARVEAAGATVIRPIRDEDYADNARGFSITDPEGNIWSIGSYAGQ